MVNPRNDSDQDHEPDTDGDGDIDETNAADMAEMADPSDLSDPADIADLGEVDRSPLAHEAEAALADIAAMLPEGEDRPGQRVMAQTVGDAIDLGGRVAIQAGTGTGKSLAYLIPAVLSGKTTVVATATKTLQDQLANKDLPRLAEAFDEPFTYSVLKGRSNYVCVQRLSEIEKGNQLGFDGMAERASTQELDQLAAWAEETTTGDKAELAVEPSYEAWAAVSVGSRECPGASRCPKGEECFAEKARAQAAASDVIVVNTHLFGLNLAADGAILPEHEVVVLDEAHQTEDIISATAGIEIGPGRLRALARLVKGLVDDEIMVAHLESSADLLHDTLEPHAGRRLKAPVRSDIIDAILDAREQADRSLDVMRKIKSDDTDVATRKQRVQLAATALVDDIDRLAELPPTDVAWVEGGRIPSLKVAPLDVGEFLVERLWDQPTVVLTSATLSPTIGATLGADDMEFIDVGSPFEFEENSLLYCAAHLPPPRSDAFEPASWDELERLITAAGGRTLALFTSHRACEAATEELRGRLDFPILRQGELSKGELTDQFKADDKTCLFATISFWQGVDVPGPTLSLVTIDKLPFPRPDEPLLQARREQARAEAFRTVDLPRASTMLAQGVGRLIRSATDRGVVAVLDNRLATSPHYRWELINALPPMPRTKEFNEVEKFLADL